MRTLLVHKSSAGDGAHACGELTALLRAAGGTVTACDADAPAWAHALDTVDRVVVAGGDGTVARVAAALVDRPLPLAILPLGTANNIATRLGIGADAEAVVAGLAEAERRAFDVGVAEGPWGTRLFFEGVGVGAFARAMAFVKTEKGGLLPSPSDRAASMHRDLDVLRAILRDLDAHPCPLTLDGVTETAAPLLLEVSNTGLIGANIPIAPDADCGDGRLDVVVAGESDRATLLAYLDARLEGEDAPPPTLPVRQATAVRFAAEGVRVHLDGHVWPSQDEAPPAVGDAYEVEIHLRPGALDVLVPA